MHPLSIFDQLFLHVACWRRDHKTAWHLAGCWRAVSPIVKVISAGIIFVSLF